MPDDQLSGYALDRAVAERVMGMFPCDQWKMDSGLRGIAKHCKHPNCFPASTHRVSGGSPANNSPANYSESIEAAMQAVEKMRERGYGWTICTHRDGWFVRCFELPDEGLTWRHSTVVKESLANAVCLSALAALEESEMAKEKFGRAALATTQIQGEGK